MSSLNPKGYRVALVTFPWKGIISWQTSAWCVKVSLEMLKDKRISSVYLNYHEGNCPISMLRNLAVKAAMNERCDYILMIDYDMVPDPPGFKPFWKTAWEFTMQRRATEEVDFLLPPTIAAPYFSNSEGHFQAYEWNQSCQPGDEDLVLIDKQDALSRRGMGTVVAAQTGLILYDMRVFWYMPKPWFAYEWKDPVEEKVNLADDFYQTRNLTLTGFPVYIAWDCWSAHLKPSYVVRPAIAEEESWKSRARQEFTKRS